MNGQRTNGTLPQDERASALDVGLRAEAKGMTVAERRQVVDAGCELAQYAGGTWLLIRGEFVSDNTKKGTEGHVRDMLRGAFGYPPTPGMGSSDITLNVLLDSPGGSLDSAYTAALYMAEYSTDVRVHVPRRAKSASTLLALGADELHLSAFGELGPLDTQISDPRNPASFMSALDCYQSVDYVRDFGIRTLHMVLPELVEQTDGKIAVSGLLEIAVDYTLGLVKPMMENVAALDFGGWGRSLRIGEFYARRLLRMHAREVDEGHINDIAARLVFEYTHHLFPIDYREANRIGLPVRMMEDGVYERAAAVVESGGRKDFVGFLSKDEAKKVEPWCRGLTDGVSPVMERDPSEGGDHAQAQTRLVRRPR
ncbi:SDH family Clp fold serine proteinase [Actinomycetota bacterium Odt1-20B]